ncbi:MAG: energy-coupling factor ABC transporter permease [Desulfobacteraceae bacterium]|nr:energy-coupling factor ABC transporter permease [Desulfobacteraceae bacterium]
MHIPDGFVSGPVNVATYAASIAVCGLAVARANKTIGERQVPLLGVTAAFIFAAQMLQFPVAGGTSGHFLGALLAAVLLGPLNACLIMTLVLGIQCLAFADGGLTALGTNIFNMGIIGGIGCYYLFQALKSILPKTRRGFLAAVAISAWSSVVLASAVCALELAVSGTSPLKVALPAMTVVHALIGLGEAIITTVVISIVLASRPDLVATWKLGPGKPKVAVEV